MIKQMLTMSLLAGVMLVPAYVSAANEPIQPIKAVVPENRKLQNSAKCCF